MSAANGGLGIRGRKIESCRDGIKILPENVRCSFLILEGEAILGAPNALRDKSFFWMWCTEIKVSSTVKETSHYKVLSVKIPLYWIGFSQEFFN